MSFEGYYQIKCLGTPSHYTTQDCYTYDSGQPCEQCGEPTISKLVDTTNGEGEGYDESFSEGCDKLISMWQSDVDKMREDMKALIKAYKKYRFTREYSEEDQLVDRIRKEYNLSDKQS